MSRAYNEGTTDAEKEGDYDGLSQYLDDREALANHDHAVTWAQGERHFIPRVDGTGEEVEITSVTPSLVYFVTDTGQQNAISRTLLARLTAERESRD